MAIQRPDPLRDMVELQERMNRLFDEVVSRALGPSGVDPMESTGWKPPVDLLEREDRYVLKVDLPGVAPGDVQLGIEGESLALRGERQADPDVPRESYLRVERPSGRFTLNFTLPPSVDPQAIKASHRNGVLEIGLPKRKASKPDNIEVEVT